MGGSGDVLCEYTVSSRNLGSEWSSLLSDDLGRREVERVGGGGGGGGHITNRAFACILCHGNGGHFGAQPSLCTKMAAVAVAKLLLCCDNICKCSVDD